MVADAGTATFAARPTCYRCFRPAAMCLCAAIRPVDNRCHVTVLQHPRERAHPFSTVRFVRLGLCNAAVHVARTVGGRELCCPLTPRPRAGLLFPSASAAVLDEAGADQLPASLIVLDGTWSHARRLYYANPWLAELPHFRLAAAAPSRYRIRRQPAAHCLSTIEAVVRALAVLEPDTPGLGRLLDGFEAMVEGQLHIAAGRPSPRTRRRSQSAGDY